MEVELRETAAGALPVPLDDHGSAAPGVVVDGLRHTYMFGGSTVPAIANVSFKLSPGRFMSLIGPSGCGKSTLLKIVGGLIAPSAGKVEVGGEPVVKPRQEIGYMFQDATLLPWRTAIDNVLLPIEVRYGKRVAARSRDLAQRLLEMTGIGDFPAAYPSQLSGGMAQRVAICRMLVTGPRLLLLDEPFGALDELTRESMNLELQRVCSQRSATTIMVTHSIPEAVFLGDVVMVMSKRPGRISHQIEIDLPRPRNYRLTTEPRFGKLVNAVREALGQGG